MTAGPLFVDVHAKSFLIWLTVPIIPSDLEVVLTYIDIGSNLIRPYRPVVFLVFDLETVFLWGLERRSAGKRSKRGHRIGKFEDKGGEYIASRWVEGYPPG